MLDRLKELHEHQFAATPDTEIQNRIDHYEMAFRMQSSIPEVTDLSDEPQHVLDSYGPDVKTPGTFAANCLQARRMAERACVSSSSTIRTGIITAAFPPPCRSSAKKPTSPLPRW
jgi:hypothetical protein